MYILKEDHEYFERLIKTLDEAGQLRFRSELFKSTSQKVRAHISQVEVIHKIMLQEWLIEPHELITRAMIDDAFEKAKEAGR